MVQGKLYLEVELLNYTGNLNWDDKCDGQAVYSGEVGLFGSLFGSLLIEIFPVVRPS